MNAIMTKLDLDTAEHRTPKWEGLSEIDQAMCDPAKAAPRLAGIAMDDLLIRRAEVSEKLDEAEAQWLALGEQLETLEHA